MSAQAAPPSPLPPWVTNPLAFDHDSLKVEVRKHSASFRTASSEWTQARWHVRRAAEAAAASAGVAPAVDTTQPAHTWTNAAPNTPSTAPSTTPRKRERPLVACNAPRAIAGRGGVSVAALQNALGHTPFRLWSSLLSMRGQRSGKTTVTVAFLANNIIHKSVPQTERALHQLKVAGLMEVDPKDRSEYRDKWINGVFVRTTQVKRLVKGDLPAQASPNDVCAVPRSTEEWVAKLDRPKRGRPVTTGVWASRGRTEKQKRWKAVRDRAYAERDLALGLSSTQALNAPESVKRTMGPGGENDGVGCEKNDGFTDLLSIKNTSTGHYVSSTKKHGPLARVPSELQKTKTGGTPSPITPSTPPQPGGTPSFFSSTAPPRPIHPDFKPGGALAGLLSRPRSGPSGGSFRRHPIAYGAKHPLVPALPVGGVLAVVLPPTPKLDEAMEDYRKVHLVRRAFEGAVETRRKELGLRGGCFTFRGVRVQGRPRMNAPIDPEHPQYALLLAAANILIENDIAPAAWCAFVIEHVWLSRMKQKRVPPLSVMFTPEKMQKWCNWFNHELASYSGTRNVFPPFVRDFVATYARMRADLCALDNDATDADIQRIVTKHFARGVQAEIDRLQEKLDVLRDEVSARVSQGKWVWDEKSTVIGESWAW